MAKPTLGNRVELYALRGIVTGLGFLPWDVACRAGGRLAVAAYKTLGIRKDVVKKQIAAAFPEMSSQEVERIARASYDHLGRTAIEIALLPKLGRKGVLDIVDSADNWNLIESAMAAGKGIVFVGGHHGNWELIGAYLAARGVPLDAIARGAANPLFETYVNGVRESLGMTIVHDTEAVRRTPRSLRAGRAVAFIADQGVLGLASTYVTFFGRPAKTPRGAAVFALRFNAPVLFLDGLRQPNGKYRIIIEPVEVASTGDRERDVDAIVVRYTEMLEKWVRLYPEQYFWQHRRWKRQPDDTPLELRDPTGSED